MAARYLILITSDNNRSSACNCVGITANDDSIFSCLSHIICNGIDKVIETTDKNGVLSICPGLDIILFVVEQYRCGAAKNHGIFATRFKSDFPFTFPRIPIVRPQVAIQTDDVFRRSFLAIIFCRDIINVDAPTGINLQIIFSIIQLFHDDNVVVILTVGNFDKAVVSSRRVLILGYRFWGLRIVVGRAIGIDLIRRQLFPLDGIAGDIACIMAESNGICFIRRSLIADGRAIFRGDD